MRITPNLPLTLNQIKRAVGVPASSTDRVINSIVTNSAEVQEGDLFFALKGERFDGEDFLPEAKSMGAFTVSSKSTDADIVVSDTQDALLRLAGYYKTRLPNLRFTVAITGSVGKTTTKNIISDMLKPSFYVHSTHENENNELGVAYTLLSAPKNTEVLVVEAGMNHLGEIERISYAISPTVAVITSIASAHIGNLGCREMIAKAKLEILCGMKNPIIIAEKGETLLESVPKLYTVSTTDMSADCCVYRISEMLDSQKFGIISKVFNRTQLSTQLNGEHILKSIGFGVGVMEILGIEAEKIKSGIENISRSCIRQKVYKIGDIRIYDDTYSASAEAVILNLRIMTLFGGERSCMLGDMLELGNETEKLHRLIGKEATLLGFRHLYLFGAYAPFIKGGAIDAGMAEDRIFINTDTTSPEITAKQIYNNRTKDEIILFKASRAVKAERVLCELQKLFEFSK